MILVIATAGLVGAIVIRGLLENRREARVALRMDPRSKLHVTRKR